METNLNGNFYSYKKYLSWDMKKGVLENPAKTRMIAFPSCFMVGLLEGLEDECGQAWSIVMYRCGEWWGKRQMQRMEKILGEHFGKPLHELPTAQVHATVLEGWATEGWGRLKLDLENLQHGFVFASVSSSPITEAFLNSELDARKRPVDFLTAGALAGMFSQASDSELIGYQIACVTQGAETNEFLIGQKEVLEDVQNMVKKGMSAAEILASLTQAH